MKEVELYFYQQTEYRVNLEIKKVCSHNSEDKRAIENITMRLFNKNKLISEYKFTEGFWLPSSSKFVLKNKEKINSGCFKGNKRIQINIKENYINSITGLYLNLESKRFLNTSCPELASK